MSDIDKELGAALTRETEWRGGETELWRHALASAQSPGRDQSRAPWRRARIIGTAIAATLGLATVGVLLLQDSADTRPWPVASSTQGDWDPTGNLYKDSSGTNVRGSLLQRAPAARHSVGTAQQLASLDAESQGRLMVRQASMLIESENVQLTYASIVTLADGLLGEFVESAMVSGEGQAAHAVVVLRVSADRLEGVMRSVRDIGMVVQEQVSASDVTDRAIDLEAQVRNERRIELELLDLLSSRPDAPLTDVLRVRESLSAVRLAIERLEGQRQGLTKRVALASCTISVRSKATPPDELLGGSFLDSLRGAFMSGGVALGKSIAWMIEVFVGGLLLWLIALGLGVWVYRACAWRGSWA